jgi:hypothetical protein
MDDVIERTNMFFDENNGQASSSFTLDAIFTSISICVSVAYIHQRTVVIIFGQKSSSAFLYAIITSKYEGLSQAHETEEFVDSNERGY